MPLARWQSAGSAAGALPLSRIESRRHARLCGGSEALQCRLSTAPTGAGRPGAPLVIKQAGKLTLFFCCN